MHGFVAFAAFILIPQPSAINIDEFDHQTTLVDWASHASPLATPIGDDIRMTGSQYVAWRILVPEGGSTLTFTREGTPTESAMIRYGLWVWKPEDMPGTLLASWGGTVFTAYRAFLQSDDLNGGIPLFNARTNVACLPPIPVLGGCSGFNSSNGIELPRGGEWTLLAIIGADGPWNGSFRFSLTAGGDILDRVDGAAFLDREDQFRGQLNLFAENPYSYFKSQDRVAVDHIVTGGFFGMFGGRTDTGLLRMGYDGPSGSEDGKTLYRFDNAPGGNYRFRVDYDVETRFTSTTWVLGAVVDIPWIK